MVQTLPGVSIDTGIAFKGMHAGQQHTQDDDPSNSCYQDRQVTVFRYVFELSSEQPSHHSTQAAGSRPILQVLNA